MGACLKNLSGNNHADRPLPQKKQTNKLQEERQIQSPGKKQEAPVQPPAALLTVRAPAPQVREQPVPQPSPPPTPETLFMQFSQGKTELLVEDAQNFFAQLKFPLDSGAGLIAFYLLRAESFQALRAVEIQQYCRE